jgi:hypothetical protein
MHHEADTSETEREGPLTGFLPPRAYPLFRLAVDGRALAASSLRASHHARALCLVQCSVPPISGAFTKSLKGLANKILSGDLVAAEIEAMADGLTPSTESAAAN